MAMITNTRRIAPIEMHLKRFERFRRRVRDGASMVQNSLISSTKLTKIDSCLR